MNRSARIHSTCNMTSVCLASSHGCVLWACMQMISRLAVYSTPVLLRTACEANYINECNLMMHEKDRFSANNSTIFLPTFSNFIYMGNCQIKLQIGVPKFSI